VEFKTDNRELFDFSLEAGKEAGWKILACTYDLHKDPQMNAGNVMTEYEEKFSGMGNPIHKLIAVR
jgi:tRNA (guanine-N7-)-methyltransferase